MKEVLFTGVGTAISTPFTEEDEVNFSELQKFIEFQISNNVDSIIVCGTTGEAATMTKKEKIETIECCVKSSKNKIPIIAGTGSNNTKEAIEISKIAKSLNVDGILVVTPYYNKCTQLGLFKHFSKVAEAIYPLPVILYNVPSRTGVNIEPETCLELSKIENIVAIKEASGNISQVAKIASLCGDNLNIYSGNDDQILPILSLGGLGAISVLSNIQPKIVHNMIIDFLSGNIESSRKLQLHSFSLIQALFSEVNPIPVKYALNHIGFNFGKPRLPLTELKNPSNLNSLLDITTYHQYSDDIRIS